MSPIFEGSSRLPIQRRPCANPSCESRGRALTARPLAPWRYSRSESDGCASPSHWWHARSSRTRSRPYERTKDRLSSARGNHTLLLVSVTITPYVDSTPDAQPILFKLRVVVKVHAPT